jgi:hypothetical protein
MASGSSCFGRVGGWRKTVTVDLEVEIMRLRQERDQLRGELAQAIETRNLAQVASTRDLETKREAESLAYKWFHECRDAQHERDQEIREVRRLRAELRAAVDALRVEQLRRERKPNPWGHDCRWCAACSTVHGRLSRRGLILYDPSGDPRLRLR